MSYQQVFVTAKAHSSGLHPLQVNVNIFGFHVPETGLHRALLWEFLPQAEEEKQHKTIFRVSSSNQDSLSFELLGAIFYLNLTKQ